MGVILFIDDLFMMF